MIGFNQKNQIKITQIDDPHKFWYKKCNDVEDQRLKELEDSIEKYVLDQLEWQEQLPINRGDEVAVFHPEWKKWIRGKAGKLIPGSKTDIFIWAIDYGCKLLLPLESVYLLSDRLLAYKSPINVHIGGLSGISPAKVDYDTEEMVTKVIKCDSWTRESIDKFTELVRDQKYVTFHEDAKQSERCFGKMFLHSGTCDNNTLSIINGLCELDVAKPDSNYIYDVRPLDREDFLRLNHQMAFRSESDNEMETADDEMANAERIFLNDEILSSINLELEEESYQVNCSHSQGNRSQHARSHVSSSLAISGINGESLSENTNTLSVKLLNKLNVLIITSDDVTPAENWHDMGYFKEETKTFLKRFFTDGIERTCSFAWPHIMRSNSLLLISEPVKNLLLCLPTVCSIKQTICSNWSTSEFFEPIALIFVTCAEEVERMAKYCRKMIHASKQSDVNVFCLSSSFEIEALIKTAETIDILVAPVFCYDAIVKHMPKLKVHLRYVWFHQIDKMCEISEDLTYNATDQLVMEDLDIQVVTTSSSYCPILNDIFARAKTPMISIGDRSPFEAAIFAKCHFSLAFEESSEKYKRLIEKLQYRLSGSIVIMCANQMDVKFVTGHLTQANIKCIDLDDQYSRNQMKLVKWSKRCFSVETQSSSYLNILVCDDKTLEKFPIRSAQHIIHYSLPDKLQVFKQRHITCYGFYEDRLRRKLLNRENDLSPCISHVYFDENLTEEYIEIFELLLKRTQCQPPPVLIETVQQMRFNFERSKMKPVCSEMITRSVDCDMQCPYRHTLYNNCNDTFVPEYGFVNMELLSVLAPNHFAVRVIGHKRQRANKSRSVEDLNTEWEQFDKKLREYYANVSRELQDPIEIGDMCLIFHQSQPKRCRVISKDSKKVSVYLVDIGRIRSFAPHQLYHLDDEFHDFPTQTIEVFVLGYLPADFSPKWLPEAKDYVEQTMRSMKKQRKTQNYLQAEVIKAFERTLIVKDLRIFYKDKENNHKVPFESIGRNLIKYGFATEVPIVLHDIFMDNTDDESNSQINSEMIDNTEAYPRCSMQVSRTPSSDGIRVTSLENCANPTALNIPFMKKKRYSESTTPASLDDGCSLYWDEGGAPESYDYIDAGTNTTETIQWDDVNSKQFHNNYEVGANVAENVQEPIQASDANDIDIRLIDFDVRVGANGKIIRETTHCAFQLDEIFGSLPEAFQAADVLVPIQCNQSASSSSNGSQEIEDENTGWLIDFSD